MNLLPFEMVCIDGGASKQMVTGGEGVVDADLVRRARTGDMAAFGELFAAYRVRAYRTAFLIAQERGLAEDLTQEAFIRAYQAIGRCDPDRPFLPWLLRILINLSRTAVRRRGRQVSVAEVTGADTMDGDFAAESDDRVLVWRALSELEPIHRDVLMLRYYHDFAEAEIAEALALPVGTVKSRLHHARRRLEERLGTAETARVKGVLIHE
jgi:RNA polymerase sigma-70 factor (ECF subfamily)